MNPAVEDSVARLKFKVVVKYMKEMSHELSRKALGISLQEYCSFNKFTLDTVVC